MVFPLSDDNSDRQRVPWITWSLITANVLVFVLFQQGGTNDSVTLALLSGSCRNHEWPRYRH